MIKMRLWKRNFNNNSFFTLDIYSSDKNDYAELKSFKNKYNIGSSQKLYTNGSDHPSLLTISLELFFKKDLELFFNWPKNKIDLLLNLRHKSIRVRLLSEALLLYGNNFTDYCI